MIHRHTERTIRLLREAFIPFARFILFGVYVWFGVLKIAGLSPAGPAIHQLFDQTIHFISFDTFYVLVGCFEIFIGILFLFPKVIRIAIPLLVVRMLMVSLLLITAPQITWAGFLIPTAEGQYIIKNIVVLVIAIGIAAHVHPVTDDKK